jgi:anti-sigma factor RsiW
VSPLRKPMACRELVELVTAYFDGAMSRRDRKRFESHIAGCDACTAYLEQMRLTVQVSGRLTEESIDPSARDELLAAFRGWKQQGAAG